MKERISGLKNESSKTKRTGLFQRITAAFPLPLIIIYNKVSSTFLPNLSLFWHINEGIEEIMADHVHQEMTRNWILVSLRLFLLIVIKDVFLSLISFPNKSKNLMDRTHPWLLAMKDIGLALRNRSFAGQMGCLEKVVKGPPVKVVFLHLGKREAGRDDMSLEESNCPTLYPYSMQVFIRKDKAGTDELAKLLRNCV